MPSSTNAGSRNVYGVIERFLVIGRFLCLEEDRRRCSPSTERFGAGPTPVGGPERASARSEPGGSEGCDYLMSLFASVTALSSASLAGTLLNSADWTAVRTIWLTSAFFSTVGTMSAYVETMLLASGRALSSMLVGGVVKYGSS